MALRAIRAMFLALAAMIWLVPGAKAQSATFFAVLNGGNICRSIVGMVCGLGDLDGVGSVAVTIISETRLCVGLVVDNIGTPTAVRIHAGPSAINGPLVVSLSTPVGGNPGTSSGCVNVSEEELALMLASPQNFYISVRNADFPKGAIRGQLF